MRDTGKPMSYHGVGDYTPPGVVRVYRERFEACEALQAHAQCLTNDRNNRLAVLKLCVKHGLEDPAYTHSVILVRLTRELMALYLKSWPNTVQGSE